MFCTVRKVSEEINLYPVDLSDLNPFIHSPDSSKGSFLKNNRMNDPTSALSTWMISHCSQDKDNPQHIQASLVAQTVKNPPAMQETQVQFLWRREWQLTPEFLSGESHGQKLQSMGLQRIRYDWAANTFTVSINSAAHCPRYFSHLDLSVLHRSHALTLKGSTLLLSLLITVWFPPLFPYLSLTSQFFHGNLLLWYKAFLLYGPTAS